MASLSTYTDTLGSFKSSDPLSAGPIYFPLCNERGFLSAITPDLGGDIKLDHHTYLTAPVSIEDLRTGRAARNFWIQTKGATPWSVAGRSVWQRAQKDNEEDVSLEAGFLYQRVTRRNKKRGLEARVTSFVPAGDYSFEIMHVEIKNISRSSMAIAATAAVPLYGRSADNLRDHRHVTSLLNRLKKEPFGIQMCPTMTFNERGHLANSTVYYVIGADDRGKAPAGFFPTMDSFCGTRGDLEKPEALTQNRKPQTDIAENDQGRESMGAIKFAPRTLKKGETATYTVFLGIDRTAETHDGIIRHCAGPKNVARLLEETKTWWREKLSTIKVQTGDKDFNNWIQWVQAQPIFRKIFGCSFLPHFDYGRGGRGWRDLWQDCLALLLQNAEDVRADIVNNFGGVRIDGSNATIIGRKFEGGRWLPEFIADRNNISRTWMDHGVWPYLTTALYLNQTGDWNMLLEKRPYFRDALLHRAQRVDRDWKPETDPASKNKLKTRDGRVYEGTVIEHILVQTLVQFFNVGEHNIIRLEDADWNDGLDMAHKNGESVAFTALYGGNLSSLADLLEMLEKRADWKTVNVADEIIFLLDRVGHRIDYDNAEQKRQRLAVYFDTAGLTVRGNQTAVPIARVVEDLRAKAAWIKAKVNADEWINVKNHSWYNGYYDNRSRRVEGVGENGVQMTLAGQVYPIMAGTADKERVREVISAVNEYLFDEKLGGLRLNTNFKETQPNLGRAFSFAYGEKENGAVFSHMAVMYANALYQRGFAAEGHRILNSLYQMAKKSDRSRIFPGLPEYFNNEGRGLYGYLTGSASWYVLTLLTLTMGVRGSGGDLLIAPMLEPDQWSSKGNAAVTFPFAGSKIRITYSNPKRVPFERARVADVKSSEGAITFSRLPGGQVLIQRDVVSKRKEWDLLVELEAAPASAKTAGSSVLSKGVV